MTALLQHSRDGSETLVIVAAADAALKLTSGLTADDTVLFLLSGGGSALFEKPLVPGDVLDRKSVV